MQLSNGDAKTFFLYENADKLFPYIFRDGYLPNISLIISSSWLVIKEGTDKYISLLLPRLEKLLCALASWNTVLAGGGGQRFFKFCF